jgi:hypothetical protein
MTADESLVTVAPMRLVFELKRVCEVAAPATLLSVADGGNLAVTTSAGSLVTAAVPAAFTATVLVPSQIFPAALFGLNVVTSAWSDDVAAVLAAFIVAMLTPSVKPTVPIAVLAPNPDVV